MSSRDGGGGGGCNLVSASCRLFCGTPPPPTPLITMKSQTVHVVSCTCRPYLCLYLAWGWGRENAFLAHTKVLPSSPDHSLPHPQGKGRDKVWCTRLLYMHLILKYEFENFSMFMQALALLLNLGVKGIRIMNLPPILE